jgi:hypothetical protein
MAQATPPGPVCQCIDRGNYIELCMECDRHLQVHTITTQLKSGHACLKCADYPEGQLLCKKCNKVKDCTLGSNWDVSGGCQNWVCEACCEALMDEEVKKYKARMTARAEKTMEAAMAREPVQTRSKTRAERHQSSIQ